MAPIADVARFHADDCEVLVMASLACNTCLRSDTVRWELDGDRYDAAVTCHCHECEESWIVYLTPWQALRLSFLSH